MKSPVHSTRVLFLIWVAAVTFCFELIGNDAHAVPLFARKYNTTCFTCHTTPPLLNDFGRRFQANGYQLPGTNEKFAQADQPNFPLGVVAQPMVSHQQIRDNLNDTTLSNTLSFSGIELALFSSASLGSHFSYFTAIPVAVFSGVPTVDVEAADLIYTDALNDGTGSLNFRLGKFRFFIPYMANTMLTNPNADPLPYAYDPFGGKDNLVKANDLSLSEPTFGASAFGMIPGIGEGLRYDAGITGGNASDIDLNTAKAYFLSLNQTVYLNNAPVRFGGFYYGGSQDITNTEDTLAGQLVQWTNHITREGLDLEFYDPWTKRLDFFGQYMIGKDDNVDTVGVGYNMTGGFVGLNVIVLPEKLYVYGRYDILKTKETSDEQHQIDLGLQYNILPNVFFTGVYTINKETLPQTIDQTTTSIGAGFRFGF